MNIYLSEQRIKIGFSKKQNYSFGLLSILKY